MKKLLAILLILGMASMANAAISIAYNSGTGNLEVSSDTTAVWGGYLVITDDTNGTYGSVTVLASAGNTGSAEGTFDHASTLGYDVVTDINADHADPYTTIATGVQFTAPVSFTGTATGEILKIDLLDFSAVWQGAIQFEVPEPMTLSLLGLGGLALLRRRR